MEAKSRVLVGTSGFSYKDWLGNFYPQFVPQADFLKFYASKFATVEIDMTFYRIPTEEMVVRWARTVPDNFVFAAKFPQTVTHEGTMASRLEDVRTFVGVMRHLGEKLGPLLLQFPYSFKPEQEEVLMRLMSAMPSDMRISVELRNKAWLDREHIFNCMRDKNIALCLTEHPWMPRIRLQTADFVYIRFLGDHRKIEDNFSYVREAKEDELTWWRDLIAEVASSGKDLYAYFNNHFSGHAPSTAFRLLEMLEEKGRV